MNVPKGGRARVIPIPQTVFFLQGESDLSYTIKGGSRRAEKSRKVLMMMMKAAKLGLKEPGAGQKEGRS